MKDETAEGDETLWVDVDGCKWMARFLFLVGSKAKQKQTASGGQGNEFWFVKSLRWL